MNADVKRTPEEWESLLDVKILDPDGWDRRNFAADWAIPLTQSEFERKAWASTICSNWSKQTGWHK